MNADKRWLSGPGLGLDWIHITSDWPQVIVRVCSAVWVWSLEEKTNYLHFQKKIIKKVKNQLIYFVMESNRLNLNFVIKIW